MTNDQNNDHHIVGYLEGITPQISGWVCDTSAPSTRLRVHLVIDGMIQATTIAEKPRPDVAATQVGDGCYGFSFSIPSAFYDEVEHHLNIKIEGRSNVQLEGTPRTCVFPNRVLTIRAATNADRNAIIRLYNAADEEGGYPPSMDATTATRLLARFDLPKNRLLLAFVNEQAVGYLTVASPVRGPHGHVATLRINILQPHRGAQIGTALMRQAVEFVETSGLRRLELTVDMENMPAIGLYNKFGFGVEGIKRGYYFDGTHDKDMYMMARLFQPEIDPSLENV
ncbi:GNAT family N-acetyltransferase [Desulfovibrio inopinatus]|uniref:GNAT family N-acetyltransferase n=1 Tax=Desulfovibrio inopinatus TaxID=102109 RepID=UPI00040C8BF3|nr:GNAT family N-acetyltransferase [Desulfovibrio inopinatus]